VSELKGNNINRDTPWLKWHARLYLPGDIELVLGLFSNADDAARAYDAEVSPSPLSWAPDPPVMGT